MNAIVPFTFDQTPIRIQMLDGQPWFVAMDVCAALGIANHGDAVARLDDDEKGIVIADTLGGPQSVAAINESGVYKLVFRSRKPSAKRMVKWLTSIVLPSIRQTGSYGVPAPALNLSDPATLHRLLLDHTGMAMASEQRVAELEPKAAALERLADSQGSVCIMDAAKAMGVPPRRLFAWMEAHRWIYRRAEGGHWVGFQPKLDAKLIEHKGTRIAVRGRPDKWVEQVLVTPKGLARLAEAGAGR